MSFLLESHEAIGTKWWIELLHSSEQFPNNSKQLKTIERDVIELMHGFELDYSRFIDSSYIGRLNNEKYIINPPKELVGLVEWGEELRVATDNRFNLSVGKTLENMGYDKDYSFKSKDYMGKQYSVFTNNPSVFKTIDSKKIRIQDDARIDLGGIGKGWLIDKIANLLNDAGIEKYIINGGGDIYVNSKTKENFKLENPFEDVSYIGEINLLNQALGSSSPKLRKWKDRNTGKVLHHLVNMQDQESVNDVAAVFTTASNAKIADALSTCIFLSSYDVAEDLSVKYQVEFAIVYADGKYKVSSGFEGEFNRQEN